MSRSILLKSAVCVLISIAMSLAMIVINTAVYDDYLMMILGVFCGIIIAAVTKSDTRKKTIAARTIGIFSAVLTQLLLLISDIPSHIIKRIYGRHDLSFYGEEAERWFSDIGQFIENEVSIYDSCVIFFLYGLLAFFFAGAIVIFAGDKMKKRQHR